MANDREKALATLRRAKRSCTLREVEAALEAWGFSRRGTRGHAQVWTYRSVSLTLHLPHGKHLDPGAVAMVIRMIDAVAVLQQPEEEDDVH